MFFTLNFFYIDIQTILFTIFWFSFFGQLIFYRNLLIIIIFIETNLLSINLLFSITSIYLDDIMGQVVSLIIFVTAAIESVIGLFIVYFFNKYTNSLLILKLNNLQG